jgi:hypothetical protein
MRQAEEDRQNMTGRRGQAEQDSQNRNNFRIRTEFENNLEYESGVHMGLIHDSLIRVTVPLKIAYCS